MTHSDRVFMVPTHRPIERTALERHVAEIERARRTLGERLPLVIIENRSDNRPLISEVAAEHPQIDIYRLDDAGRWRDRGSSRYLNMPPSHFVGFRELFPTPASHVRERTERTRHPSSDHQL